MSRVEVISSPERRRHWSGDQKRAIVAAAFARGSSVCAFARRVDVVPGLIYRWRQAFRGTAGLPRCPSRSMRHPPATGLRWRSSSVRNAREALSVSTMADPCWCLHGSAIAAAGEGENPKQSSRSSIFDHLCSEKSAKMLNMR
jgi:transposase-like protein